MARHQPNRTCLASLRHGWVWILQKETADRKAAEEAAAAAKEEQERLLKQAMENAMPDEIQQKVQAALQKEMVRLHWTLLSPKTVILAVVIEVDSTDFGCLLQERLQLIMQAQFSKQEAGLRQRIAELEGRLASPA